MFGQTMPEAEALQKVIHTKASKAEIKAALDKFIAVRQKTTATPPTACCQS
ncbi:MAG: hypothetical protein WCQ21_27350 [Verrucomicrobiota bacterium]|jgi:hypothetical protein